MWEFLRPRRRSHAAGNRQRRVSPLLELLEGRVLLSHLPAPPPPPPPAGDDTSESQMRASSIAVSQDLRAELPPPPPTPAATPPPIVAAGVMGNQPGRAGGPPAADGSSGAPPPSRPVFNGRDPTGLLNAFAHPVPTQSAQGTVAGRTALSLHLSDFDDLLPEVEVTDALSFVENDSRLTDREFAALITNTRPRADVLPQQGSSVASVATLMPSDRPETFEEVATSELAPLLIPPLNLPGGVLPPAATAGRTSTIVPSGGRQQDGARNAGGPVQKFFDDEDTTDNPDTP
jgi:hypothetical protein